MHLEALRTFCSLVELRSFSKTADKELISQSAVSQQIAQLETFHKCQLIDRRKRPLELTAEGHLFYEACEDILERYDNFRNDLNSMKKSATSRVNVAAIFSIGMHYLQPYVKEFMGKYPDAHVKIEYLKSSQIYDFVLQGIVDIGVVAVPKPARNIDVYHLADEPLVFVCSREHAVAEQSEICIEQLKMSKFIAFEEGIPTRILIDGILEQHNVEVSTIEAFDNTETIKRAVEINTGVTILPKTVVQHEVATGSLKAIPFAGVKFARPTGIIVRKGKLLTKAAVQFIELLRGENAV